MTMRWNSSGMQAAAIAALTLLAASAAHAQSKGGNCDAIRAQIDAKIRASGAAGYTLAVVDAQAPVDTGKVVGHCQLGTRKIVYAAGSAVSAPHAASAPHSAPPILTECKDGTVTLGGDCRK